MELSGAAVLDDFDDFDDDLPCLAREECVRSLLGNDAADALNRWLMEFGDGDDD
jgi:hypothetical protein